MHLRSLAESMQVFSFSSKSTSSFLNLSSGQIPLADLVHCIQRKVWLPQEMPTSQVEIYSITGVGISDDGLTQKCLPQNCLPVGNLRVGICEIHRSSSILKARFFWGHLVYVVWWYLQSTPELRSEITFHGHKEESTPMLAQLKTILFSRLKLISDCPLESRKNQQWNVYGLYC